jgi:predicted kinase
MCGLPGAGKTTLAKQLEIERPALRLTPDEWMGPLFGAGHDEPKRAVVESLMWEVAARALRLGIDAILDFGFWGRWERDDYRSLAAALGARTEVKFLDVPRDELIRRLDIRNAALPPDTFHVTAAEIDLWLGVFEAPTADELGCPLGIRPAQP